MGAFGRAALAAVATVVGTASAGAALPPPSPDPAVQAGVTWGACGSWWTETASRMESGSVCGVDGLVTDNGRPTQLAEPLITVTRYTCMKRSGTCKDESLTGTVRRSEMTVDPLLRRASIRGTLGGCTLDVEFAGLGTPAPSGGWWENHGLTGSSPALSAGGTQTFTSQASWWGGVCGRTIAPSSTGEGRQAWMYRSIDATLGLPGSADGHEG